MSSVDLQSLSLSSSMEQLKNPKSIEEAEAMLSLLVTGRARGLSVNRNGGKQLAEFVLGAGNDTSVTTSSIKTGRDVLHTKYPQEFEYYACAFELLDYQLKTVDFFTFPVMPSMIREAKPTISNIKKTMSGVVVLNNPTFVPFEISVQGDFGKKFKAMPKPIQSSESNQISSTGLKNVVVTNVFSSDYKTGYGALKYLENLILKSRNCDSNYRPYYLLFYNLSLNSNYIVEVLDFDKNQSKEKTGVWNYSIQIKAVAPINILVNKKDVKTRMSNITNFSKIQNESKQKAVKIEVDLTLPKNSTRTIKTDIQNILLRQTQQRAFDLLNVNQQSALRGAAQLLDDPTGLTGTVPFVFNNILNRF